MAYPQYNPYYAQNQFYQQAQQAAPAPNIQAQQIQNSGIIMSISSEAEARSYPIGLGNSVTFKDENAPYIYTKTMGFSQLDRPIFEKYRLVKEENSPVEESKEPQTDNLALDEIKGQIEAIQSDIEDIKKKIAPKTVKKIMKEIEVDDDDTE